MASRDTEFDEEEDPAELERRKIRQQQDLESHLVLRDILRTYEGRQYLWRIIEKTGVFLISFKPGEADTTAFNEGRRNVGLFVLNEIMAVDQKLFAQMQAEGQERERRYKEELRSKAE